MQRLRPQQREARLIWLVQVDLPLGAANEHNDLVVRLELADDQAVWLEGHVNYVG